MEAIKHINIFTDGGSRGNPGPSASGVYIEDADSGDTLAEIGITLGVTTNNVAEYTAIVEAWNWIFENKSKLKSLSMINFYMDSNLAVNQLNGLYKIKNPNLRILLFKIRGRESEIGIPAIYTHVPREQNKKADRLVNMALDNKMNLP